MDHRSIQKNPLIYDWLRYVQEVNQAHEHIIKDGKLFWIPFLAIPTSVVNELFMITDLCDLAPKTRYLALYIYDKFMCNNFWETYKNGFDTIKLTTRANWERTLRRISDQAKLWLISSIQIASKMDSHSMRLGISQAISVLHEIDSQIDYTPNTVFNAEFKVFKTIGFKIPMGTPLDCIEILLVATGLELTTQMSEIVIHLLDLSYLEHYQLFSNLQFIINGRSARSEEEKRNFRAMEVNSLYLGASIVLCTMLLYCWSNENIDVLAAKLADLVDIDENDIRGMADLLFSVAVQTEGDED